MVDFRGVSRLLLVLFLLTAQAALGASPQRVVSMNLCTDQLAMLVAEPGQLISVSHLAVDESASVMVEEARPLIINQGLAEQVIRLNPDLVIAGTYTTRATVNLLKRLGVKVAEFQPAYSFADVRSNLKKMGELLGRDAHSSRLTDMFDQQLQEAGRTAEAIIPVLGSYGANSYTGGGSSLESEIVTAAGFTHLGSQLQLQGSSKLPLESLIYANPDLLMSWQRWSDRQGRAVEILQHPALEQWFGPQRRISVDSRYWICGTPYTVSAIQQLQAAVASKEKDDD
ncbi:MAG: ABC transporter substrate-binding protein [Amphritea sp.]|nr:ABC transporter substrate-binding protein [Amphritea sp.]